MNSIISSIRLLVVSMLICVVCYTGVILGFAKAIRPGSAEGSLVRDANGGVVGSRLIAQKFTQAKYFWPRPSAPDYNASGAAGSNKSPTNPDIATRAGDAVTSHGATAESPLPADLAAASGSGLDPHITESAALFQVERVAAARNIPESRIEELVKSKVYAPGGFMGSWPVVNVLELNIALDELDSK